MSLKRIIIYQNKILFNILNELYSDKFSFLLVDEKNFNDLNLIKESNDLIIVDQNNLEAFRNTCCSSKSLQDQHKATAWGSRSSVIF